MKQHPFLAVEQRVKFIPCWNHFCTVIIILLHVLMAEADRQLLPYMFTADIAFKKPSFKVLEDSPDILRELALKGDIFTVTSIKSDSSSLSSVPFNYMQVRLEGFFLDSPYPMFSPDCTPLMNINLSVKSAYFKESVK